MGQGTQITVIRRRRQPGLGVCSTAGEIKVPLTPSPKNRVFIRSGTGLRTRVLALLAHNSRLQDNLTMLNQCRPGCEQRTVGSARRRRTFNAGNRLGERRHALVRAMWRRARPAAAGARCGGLNSTIQLAPEPYSPVLRPPVHSRSCRRQDAGICPASQYDVGRRSRRTRPPPSRPTTRTTAG